MASMISACVPSNLFNKDITGLRTQTVVNVRPGSSALRTRRLQISCLAAKPETLATVQKIIANQLSVDETNVSPSSKFAELGADSLDTVEIMMNLEEAFKISLGEEGAEKIATVQDAADLIEDVISKN